ARPVTGDHRSIFSAWVGSEVLGSRAATVEGPASASSSPSALPSAGEPSGPSSPAPSLGSGQGVGSETVASMSFLVDPTTGQERAISGEGIYRPVIDPANDLVVYWSGTIRSTDNGLDWQPA